MLPVQGAIGSLYQLEVLVGFNVCRTLEQHVLEEVRESCPAGSLVS